MTFFDDKAYTINDLIESVIAIETELGPLPAGVYASVRTRLDILEARINNPFAPAPNVNNPFYIGGSPVSGVSIQTGFGDPNSEQIPAISGSLFLREDGYNNQGLYSFRPDGYWHQIDTDPWTACGDLAGTIYCQTVIGLQNHAINPDATLLQTDAAGDGYVLTWNALANGGHGWWEPQIGFFAAHDLAGTKINQTVIGIQSIPVTPDAPQDGYVLIYDAAHNHYEPQRLAVLFDPLDSDTTTNIRSNRYITQSPIDNTQSGIVNLGSDTSQATLGVTGSYSSNLGGDKNEVTGTYSTITGGLLNVINGTQSFVGSGNSNIVGSSSAVVTGTGNFATGTQFSLVGNGNVNTITSGSFGTIENGQMNAITATLSTILNGSNNTITGVNPASSQYNLIGNGVDGYISDQATFATIINGSGSQILAGAGAIVSGTNNLSSSPFTLIQGENNTVGNKGKFVNIVGDFNTSGTTVTNSHYTSIWGCGNVVQDGYIAMFGLHNTMNAGSTFADIHGDVNTVASPYTSIWGSQNTIGSGDGYAAIFGDHNTIHNSSPYAYVWGSNNTIQTNSPNTYAVGTSNIVTGPYNSAWGLSNTVAPNTMGYSSAWGNVNTIYGDWSNVWGYQNNIGSALVPALFCNVWGEYNTVFGAGNGAYGSYHIIGSASNPIDYTNAFGLYGSTRMQNQFVHSGSYASGGSVVSGSEQWSRTILDGSSFAGAAFPLFVAGTANPITLEPGKSYDITIRVLITQSTNLPGSNSRLASFVFDVLAHDETGFGAVLDSVNSTLLNDPDATGWSVNLSTSGDQLVVNVLIDTSIAKGNRRAVATVEWREISRL